MKSFVGILLFLCNFTIYAEIQISSSTDKLKLNESFNLTLVQKNPQNGGSIPDLTPLRKDFTVLGTQCSVNYTLINGQTQSSDTWLIILKPKLTGKLSIPSLRMGNETTQALTVEVDATKSNSTSASDDENNAADIMLKMSVSDKKPFVNQQIILKITLLNSKQLLDANYQPPQVKNAILIPLEGDKRYQTEKNGVQYLVEEQNYALFPQKSGPLKINSPIFTALIYNFNPQRISAEDKALTLNVQAIPPQFAHKSWLPAKNVSLEEEYDKNPILLEGDTIVRRVTLKGTGIPAQLLPELKFDKSNSFNVYPEKGKETNQILQGELVSNTDIKVTYLFNHSGKVTIPELTVPWFNTQTQKEEVAKLPAHEFQINAVKNASTDVETPNKNISKKEPKSLIDTTPSEVKTNVWKFNFAWLIAIFFAFAWILTLILWKKPLFRKTEAKSHLKTLFHKFEISCKENNALETKDNLLAWAQAKWPKRNILNLSEIAERSEDPALKQEIAILTGKIYQQTSITSWQGARLLNAVRKLNNMTPNKPSKNRLPPRNPI